MSININDLEALTDYLNYKFAKIANGRPVGGIPKDPIISEKTVKEFILKKNLVAIPLDKKIQYFQGAFDAPADTGAIVNNTDVRSKLLTVAEKPVAAADSLTKQILICGGIKYPHLHCEGEIYKLTNDQWNQFAIIALEELRNKFAKVNTISFDNFVKFAEVVEEEV
ncbi:MAG: hypothetical protein FWH37_03780 [Candidatus Bathyarchaeota archaeon]|nr:hypothetical protein [Candidatus Termiticorpusculum sp.]